MQIIKLVSGRLIRKKRKEREERKAGESLSDLV